MVGRFLDGCVVGSLALGLGLYFSGHEGVLGVGKAIQRDERRIARETKLKWTLYGQGYFSRRHGLYFLENGFLHVYGELTTNPDQRPDGQANVAMTDESSVQEEGERYLHEVYGLENGKWEKKLEGFSRRPVQYLDFGSCDVGDELDLERPDIALAFRAWPGTKMKIKNVTEFPQGYAAVVYSEIPGEKGIAYGPEDRTLQVALLVRSKPGWRLVDGIDGTMQPGYFCGIRTLSAVEDGAVHPVFLMFSVQGDFSVLNSYILD